MHTNPYETPEHAALRARRRDRVMLMLTATGIFAAFMALTIVAAIFRLFG